MTTLPEGDLFTPVEVADILKITLNMAWALMRRGEIPAIKVGRFWRVKREDLEAFLTVPDPLPLPKEEPIC